MRECNSPRSRIDFRLEQLEIFNTASECNSRSSGIDIKFWHAIVNVERDVQDCNQVGRTSSPHDIVRLQRQDPAPCRIRKDLKLGQLNTSNISREGKVTSWCGEMDTKSKQQLIFIDMRLLLFWNNCSGKQTSSVISLILREASVESLLIILSNAVLLIPEIHNFLRVGKLYGALVNLPHDWMVNS